jgi:hypothetical protein
MYAQACTFLGCHKGSCAQPHTLSQHVLTHFHNTHTHTHMYSHTFTTRTHTHMYSHTFTHFHNTLAQHVLTQLSQHTCTTCTHTTVTTHLHNMYSYNCHMHLQLSLNGVCHLIKDKYFIFYYVYLIMKKSNCLFVLILIRCVH